VKGWPLLGAQDGTDHQQATSANVRTQESTVNKFNTRAKPITPEVRKAKAPQGKMYQSLADLAALIRMEEAAGDKFTWKGDDHLLAASIQKDEYDQRRKAMNEATAELCTNFVAGQMEAPKMDALPANDRKEVVDMIVEAHEAHEAHKASKAAAQAATANEPTNIFDMPFADRFKVVEDAVEAEAPAVAAPAVERRPTDRDPILIVAKRAVIADQRGAECYDKSSSYGETTAASVLECNERFAEVSPTWEQFVADYLPFGLPWANELLRIAKASPEDRKGAFDKRNEAQRQRRIARGEAAPKAETLVDEQVSEVRTCDTKRPMTNAEKQARKNAKNRTTDLASIEHRRLFNTLKGRLAAYSFEMLKDAAAMLDDYECRRAERKAA